MYNHDFIINLFQRSITIRLYNPVVTIEKDFSYTDDNQPLKAWFVDEFGICEDIYDGRLVYRAVGFQHFPGNYNNPPETDVQISEQFFDNPMSALHLAISMFIMEEIQNIAADIQCEKATEE